MKFNKLLIIPISLVILSGCANNDSKKFVDLKVHYITTKSAPEAAVDKRSQQQLAQTAVSVGHSLQNLSAIQKANNPGAKIAPPLNPGEIGMAQPTSVKWTGPVESIVSKIADTSHYKLRVLGNKPAIPVIVSVNAQNQPLADILRSITYQVVNKADIKVYPNTKVIELRYYQS